MDVQTLTILIMSMIDFWFSEVLRAQGDVLKCVFSRPTVQTPKTFTDSHLCWKMTKAIHKFASILQEIFFP